MQTSRYYDDDFNEYLEDLLKRNFISGAAAGITKQVLDRGYDSLSDAQKVVFDEMISKNSVEQCKFGEHDIPWSEMIEALENGGYCSNCSNNLNKD